MARARCGRTALAFLALLCLAMPSVAGPIPSRAADSPAVDSHQADRATIEAFLAQDEVARALAAHGLSADEVEYRIAQLSEEDVSALVANLDQIQAAGEVPNYIWILLAILIGVTIIATVL
jgi:hypothetical protein